MCEERLRKKPEVSRKERPRSPMTWLIFAILCLEISFSQRKQKSFIALLGNSFCAEKRSGPLSEIKDTLWLCSESNHSSSQKLHSLSKLLCESNLHSNTPCLLFSSNSQCLTFPKLKPSLWSPIPMNRHAGRQHAIHTVIFVNPSLSSSDLVTPPHTRRS